MVISSDAIGYLIAGIWIGFSLVIAAGGIGFMIDRALAVIRIIAR